MPCKIRRPISAHGELVEPSPYFDIVTNLLHTTHLGGKMDEQTLHTVAYCGLDCATCFSYKKTVSEAAKSLRRELHDVKLKEFWTDIPFLGEYESFKKSLDGLAKLRCTSTCRNGGGNPWCKIRICSQKKELTGCWECDDVESCNKLIERYRKNTRLIKKVGIEKFLKSG